MDIGALLGTFLGEFAYAAFLWLYNLILPFIGGFSLPF